MAYAVSQRTHEMGIRMALGASRPEIVRVVLARGLALAGAGAAIGLVLALGMSQGISVFLFGVGKFDIATFGGVTIAVLLAAAAACYLPAQRATRVDPMVVLRAE
jgi:putative ABC transport system permease protein